MSIASYYIADPGNTYVDGSADSTANSQGFMVINGSTLRMMNQRTPASTTSAGLPGEIVIGSTTLLGITTYHIYVCVGNDLWRRVSLGGF